MSAKNSKIKKYKIVIALKKNLLWHYPIMILNDTAKGLLFLA
jgi:hypothetical protein